MHIQEEKLLHVYSINITTRHLAVICHCTKYLYKELTALSPLWSANLKLFYRGSTFILFQNIYYNFPHTNWFCPNFNLLYWPQWSAIYSTSWGFLPVANKLTWFLASAGVIILFHRHSGASGPSMSNQAYYVFLLTSDNHSDDFHLWIRNYN